MRPNVWLHGDVDPCFSFAVTKLVFRITDSRRNQANAFGMLYTSRYQHHDFGPAEARRYKTARKHCVPKKDRWDAYLSPAPRTTPCTGGGRSLGMPQILLSSGDAT